MKLYDLHEGLDQARVEKGIEAQNAAITHLEHEFGDDFELINQAGRSSKVPDITAKIHGIPTQIEVKGRNTPTSTVKIYEKTIRRGQRDRVLDAFARAHSNGEARTFDEYVDLIRERDNSYGFPGDEGVTAKAGKFYVAAEDSKTKALMRKYLIDTLRANNDDYFALYTRNSGEVEMFDIGSTNHEVPAKRMPNMKVVRVETYGGAKTPGTMRIAVKVIFQR